jgi:D-glycero-D-manno-heptose 1,7-bisphosphate phosphatase
MKRHALFLDRDGVINVDIGYLHRIEDCIFVRGIFDLVRIFHELGFMIIIATNQAGIGRGYYSEEQFRVLMAWMCEQFEQRIAAVYHCPDHPEGVGRYRRENPWRKPGPGMLLQAARDFDLDLRGSWMVGDKETDVEAARAAQVGHVVLLDRTTAATERKGDYWAVRSLSAVTDLLASNQVVQPAEMPHVH